MASIEIINIDGEESLGVNISKIVGFNGANLNEDVMAIQAFFKYIANALNPDAVGLGGDYNVPEITGKMDNDTYSAISEFQIKNAHRLLMPVFDGCIHPASYKNRVIKSKGKLMTITYLHILAKDAAFLAGDLLYSEGMIKLNRELAYSFDKW